VVIIEVLLGAAAGALASAAVYAAAGRFLATAALDKHCARIIPPVPLILACAAAGAAVSHIHSWPVLLLYSGFLAAVLVAVTVDVAEQRIPDRITYPLLAVGVLVLPVLSDHTLWGWIGPVVGGAAAGLWALVTALVADQGLGDVKLAAVIGAWMAHLGLLPWAVGLLGGQIAVVVLVAAVRVRRHRQHRSDPQLDRNAHTALGPALAAGSVLALLYASLV